MLKLADCQYCGNNPVPHRLTFINETLMVMLTPFNRWLSARWFYRFADHATDQLFVGFSKLLELIGAIKFNDQKELLKIDRAKVLWDEAERRGYKMEAARLFDHQMDFYRVKIPGRSMIYFNGLPRPEAGGEALAWLDDKMILKSKLKAGGVHVPEGASCTSVNQALTVWQKLGRPVIVKPRLGSRGRHSFTNINTAEELARAFKLAQQLCWYVMVEEFLEGTLYRGTVIGGSLVGVMGWAAPEVVGNGQKTLAELITEKNSKRQASVSEVKLGPELIRVVSEAGYELDQIVPKEVRVVLGTKIGAGYGGTSFEITDIIHSDLKEILEQAAKIVNDPIIGFDFILKNPRVSPREQSFGIIEANGLPFIQFHHYPVEGKPNNVAQHVWNLFCSKPTQ